MSSARDHYRDHLGPIYSWMLGDRAAVQEAARAELGELGIAPAAGGLAIDLGTGPGVHAVPLADLGHSVVAIDGDEGLLTELAKVAGSRPIRTVVSDLVRFRDHCPDPAGLIVCMGDTLTHLASLEAVEDLLREVALSLEPGGTFVATFRDYTGTPPAGAARFIPVKSDETRILTCLLEYGDTTVTVSDLLYTKEPSGWRLSVSSYPKLRLDPSWAAGRLARLGLDTQTMPGRRGMVALIARKPRQVHKLRLGN